MRAPKKNELPVELAAIASEIDAAADSMSACIERAVATMRHASAEIRNIVAQTGEPPVSTRPALPDLPPLSAAERAALSAVISHGELRQTMVGQEIVFADRHGLLAFQQSLITKLMDRGYLRRAAWSERIVRATLEGIAAHKALRDGGRDGA